MHLAVIYCNWPETANNFLLEYKNTWRNSKHIFTIFFKSYLFYLNLTEYKYKTLFWFILLIQIFLRLNMILQT